MPDRPKPSPRFHGRIPGQRPCAVPGCDEVGEFRAPGDRQPGFDGPGRYRWMCLDHVREFNAGYNFFAGMTPEEIVDAQGPYGGWERETRAFNATGADAPPKWSDFRDPMDALGARFRKVRQQAQDAASGVSREDREAFDALGLTPGADLKAIRQSYSTLVRRYHPDRNGGDRRYEKALQSVIAAYAHLKTRV